MVSRIVGSTQHSFSRAPDHSTERIPVGSTWWQPNRCHSFQKIPRPQRAACRTASLPASRVHTKAADRHPEPIELLGEDRPHQPWDWSWNADHAAQLTHWVFNP